MLKNEKNSISKQHKFAAINNFEFWLEALSAQTNKFAIDSRPILLLLAWERVYTRDRPAHDPVKRCHPSIMISHCLARATAH
jgi:hypothetical protein